MRGDAPVRVRRERGSGGRKAPVPSSAVSPAPGIGAGDTAVRSTWSEGRACSRTSEEASPGTRRPAGRGRRTCHRRPPRRRHRAPHHETFTDMSPSLRRSTGFHAIRPAGGPTRGGFAYGSGRYRRHRLPAGSGHDFRVTSSLSKGRQTGNTPHGYEGGRTNIGTQRTLRPTNQAPAMPAAASILSVTGGVYGFNSASVKDRYTPVTCIAFGLRQTWGRNVSVQVRQGVPPLERGPTGRYGPPRLAETGCVSSRMAESLRIIFRTPFALLDRHPDREPTDSTPKPDDRRERRPAKV